MIHPDTEIRWISEEVGYGVVATKFLPKGTITWVLDELDREFTPDQVSLFRQSFREIIEKYCYRNSDGNFILCWDNARYVNHSFNSNCLSTPYDFEIAVRDINPGEQLSDDYGYLNISEPFEGFDENTERKVVYPDDLLSHSTGWDLQLKEAFSEIHKAPQALKHILGSRKWQLIENILSGKEPMLSIQTLYYDPKKNEKKPPPSLSRAA